MQNQTEVTLFFRLSQAPWCPDMRHAIDRHAYAGRPKEYEIWQVYFTDRMVLEDSDLQLSSAIRR